MRVMCIDASNPMDSHLVRPGNIPKEGEIYHVEAEFHQEEGIFYYLHEFPFEGRRRVKYNASRFVQLENSDVKNENLSLNSISAADMSHIDLASSAIPLSRKGFNL